MEPELLASYQNAVVTLAGVHAPRASGNHPPAAERLRVMLAQSRGHQWVLVLIGLISIK